jgi:hypothetical protein
MLMPLVVMSFLTPLYAALAENHIQISRLLCRYGANVRGITLKEAVSFVQRCDANKRVDLHIECGERVMARKECKERGGRARLECVYLYLFVGSHYYYNGGGAGSYVLRGNSLIARESDQIASTMK